MWVVLSRSASGSVRPIWVIRRPCLDRRQSLTLMEQVDVSMGSWATGFMRYTNSKIITIMKSRILFLLLSCLLEVSTAWGQCAAGIESAGNPQCIPPDDSSSPYYQGSANQTQTYQAPLVRWADRWGAIATDGPGGHLGTAVDMNSRDQAERTALADCRAKGGLQCKIETWYGNSCAAMVVGDRAHTSNNANSLNEAVQIGMKTCAKGDTNCRVYYSACSLPKRIQ